MTLADSARDRLDVVKESAGRAVYSADTDASRASAWGAAVFAPSIADRCLTRVYALVMERVEVAAENLRRRAARRQIQKETMAARSATLALTAATM
jgi:hypothetical protein